MRVLRMITRLNVGGPAKQVAFLHRHFREHGHEVRLITGALSVGEADGSEGLLDEPDVQVYTALARALQPLKDTWCLLRLIAELLTRPCDVLHTHTTKAGLLGRTAVLISSRLLRLRGFPKVKTLHTYHGHVFQGYFSPQLTKWIVKVERFLAKRTSHIVVISESQRRDIAEVLKLPEERLALIPLGLDLVSMLTVERKPVFDAHNDRFVVGWIGRMVPIKGMSLLLDIVAHCRLNWSLNECPLFVVVGGGELHDAFVAELKERGLEDLVVLLGWKKDMVEVMSGMDVVLNTSVNEGTSVALIEAQAAGVPVVATAVGGTVDVVGPSSHLYAAGDVAHAHASLESICAHLQRVPESERHELVRRHGLELLGDRLFELMSAQS